MNERSARRAKEFSDILLVGEFVGGGLGLIVLRVTFNIHMSRSDLAPALGLLGLGSLCTVQNLLLLALVRRRSRERETIRWGLAWLGLPMILLTLLMLGLR